MRLTAALLALTISLLLSACSGAGVGNSPAPAPAPPSVDRTTSGRAVVKLLALPGGWLSLQQRLSAVPRSGSTQPDPRLQWSDAQGRVLAEFMPPAGWSLIDATSHPSGEGTAVLAGDRAMRLLRFDAAGALLRSVDLIDVQASTDPFIDLGGGERDNVSLVPVRTRDAARLAAIGEDIALVIRTGRTAVIAYRLTPTGSGFDRVWRELVEPGTSYYGRGFLGYASYDTFGQLDNHWHVYADAGADGSVFVAVTQSTVVGDELRTAHNQHFGEQIGVENGGLLTPGPDGRRAWTRVVDTGGPSEVHGVRVAGSRVAVFGRVRTARLGDGSGGRKWRRCAAGHEAGTPGEIAAPGGGRGNPGTDAGGGERRDKGDKEGGERGEGREVRERQEETEAGKRVKGPGAR
ncbi:MAG: hypothetical protein U5L03_04430 [Burkholderiaceae bacterium]|nr:hypothetical protein [Burkholderiaceae bacterium]